MFFVHQYEWVISLLNKFRFFLKLKFDINFFDGWLLIQALFPALISLFEFDRGLFSVLFSFLVFYIAFFSLNLVYLSLLIFSDLGLIGNVKSIISQAVGKNNSNKLRLIPKTNLVILSFFNCNVYMIVFEGQDLFLVLSFFPMIVVHAIFTIMYFCTEPPDEGKIKEMKEEKMLEKVSLQAT